eukprot:CAMPEP_0194386578 /NCGR_PEP_ID=MMETSP0174-20130528/87254_1 /TAXON_ID=216777 /ORGANISM="Proboscia alata, Strain PI-D3" /LENGTH=130 /DNA_ID=CAMNT_0039175917 /DNA_START=26 /DNA_END=415 /DNA_ORIENTATION=+
MVSMRPRRCVHVRQLWRNHMLILLGSALMSSLSLSSAFRLALTLDSRPRVSPSLQSSSNSNSNANPNTSNVLEVDTCVIGGGVSGLTAAIYSRKGGGRTLLTDCAMKLGGVVDTKTTASADSDSRGSFVW